MNKSLDDILDKAKDTAISALVVGSMPVVGALSTRAKNRIYCNSDYGRLLRISEIATGVSQVLMPHLYGLALYGILDRPEGYVAGLVGGYCESMMRLFLMHEENEVSGTLVGYLPSRIIERIYEHNESKRRK